MMAEANQNEPAAQPPAVSESSLRPSRLTTGEIHELTRLRIGGFVALFLVALLALTIVFIFVLSLTDSPHEAVELGQFTLPPLTTLVGPVLVYYFSLERQAH